MEIDVPHYTQKQNEILSEIAELQREINGYSINPNYFLKMTKSCAKLKYKCERYLYLYCKKTEKKGGVKNE